MDFGFGERYARYYNLAITVITSLLALSNVVVAEGKTADIYAGQWMVFSAEKKSFVETLDADEAAYPTPSRLLKIEPKCRSGKLSLACASVATLPPAAIAALK